MPLVCVTAVSWNSGLPMPHYQRHLLTNQMPTLTFVVSLEIMKYFCIFPMDRMSLTLLVWIQEMINSISLSLCQVCYYQSLNYKVHICFYLGKSGFSLWQLSNSSVMVYYGTCYGTWCKKGDLLYFLVNSTFFSILKPLPRLTISIPQQFLLIKRFLITHGVFCPSQR